MYDIWMVRACFAVACEIAAKSDFIREEKAADRKGNEKWKKEEKKLAKEPSKWLQVDEKKIIIRKKFTLRKKWFLFWCWKK